MPIYAYGCQSCGHEFDALQKISDSPLIECPACQKESLKKLLTAPSFRLSGSGWYETDFKKDKQKNLAGDKKPAGDSTASDTKSTASKTEGSAKPAADAS